MFKKYPLAKISDYDIEEFLCLGNNFVPLNSSQKKIVYIPAWNKVNNKPTLAILKTEPYLLDFINKENNYILLDFSSEMIIGDLSLFDNFSQPIKIISSYTKFDTTDIIKKYNVDTIMYANVLGMRTAKWNERVFKEYASKKLDNLTQTDKIATLYIGKARPSRLITLNYFFKLNLLNQCHYTFINNSHTTTKNVEQIFYFTKKYYPNVADNKLYWDKEFLHTVLKQGSINDDLLDNFYEITPKHGLDSFFSIILETDRYSPIHLSFANKDNKDKINLVGDSNAYNHVSQSIFTTEKTFKSFVMLHPYVIFAAKGHIQDLRDRGYDTFDDIINHDYNNEDNYETNLVKFLDESVRLVKLGKQFWINFCKDNINRLYNNYKTLQNEMGTKDILAIHNDIKNFFQK